MADEKPLLSSEAMAILQPNKSSQNRYTMCCAMLASMTTGLLGYGVSVMSGAAIFIQDDMKIDDTKIEILAGIFQLYSMIGSFAGGRTSDWIGRRYTIVFASVFFFFGSLLMALAPNYSIIMAGRFVSGIGAGYGIAVAPVYVAELAPPASRGFLSSFPEFFCNIGIVIGYIINFVLADLPLNIGWRLMFAIGALPPIFLAISIIVMPESPRWLVMQGQLENARKVLQKTSDSIEEAEYRLLEIKETAGIPQDQTGDVVSVPKRNQGEGVWVDLLIKPSPSVIHILVVTLGLQFFQQATGIDSIVFYSPRVFEKAGLASKNDQLAATVLVGIVKTLSILVATLLLDRLGRRPLLLASTGGMIVSLVFLALGLNAIEGIGGTSSSSLAATVCITMVMVYVAAFSIGIGPIASGYSSEIMPLRLRAQGMSLIVAANRLTSGVVGMTFLSLYQSITIAGSFFLYAGIAVAGWIFFYVLLPETKGKSLEEIEALFAK